MGGKKFSAFDEKLTRKIEVQLASCTSFNDNVFPNSCWLKILLEFFTLAWTVLNTFLRKVFSLPT